MDSFFGAGEEAFIRLLCEVSAATFPLESQQETTRSGRCALRGQIVGLVLDWLSPL